MIVNAIQRLSTVVVQRSLAEGFGLTVLEAMWKSRPVIASRVGGIVDQIVDGDSGVLVQDPADLREFGEAVLTILRCPALGARMGQCARERVADRFLATRSLMQYAGTLATLGLETPALPRRRGPSAPTRARALTRATAAPIRPAAGYASAGAPQGRSAPVGAIGFPARSVPGGRRRGRQCPRLAGLSSCGEFNGQFRTLVQRVRIPPEVGAGRRARTHAAPPTRGIAVIRPSL